MAVADVYLLCHINFTLTVFLKIVRKAEWVFKKVDLCSSGSFLCFPCTEKVRKINRSMSASGQTVCLFFFSNVTINMCSEFHSWCISAFYEIFRADRSAYCVLLQ